MWVTLDGFIAGPNGEMDWVTSIYDDAMGNYEDELVSNADTLLLGRVTYQSFASAWPKVPENPSVSEGEKQYARKLNAMQKIVFSKTLDKAEWNNSTVKREVIPEEIEKIKQVAGKDILIYGSASIVHELANLRLIDEYQLLLHPVVLGGGKPLFGGKSRENKLKLTRTKASPSGVVLLCYQPVNE
jgi:dihydrofolate reductase